MLMLCYECFCWDVVVWKAGMECSVLSPPLSSKSEEEVSWEISIAKVRKKTTETSWDW